MAKLTRAQQARLRYALDSANAARAYIHSEQTAICAVSSFASTTLHFTRQADDRILYEVAKHSSPIACLDTTITELKRLLEQP